jgi:hypothetical protein
VDQIVIQELDDQIAVAGLVLDTLDLCPDSRWQQQTRPGNQDDDKRNASAHPVPKTSAIQATGQSVLGSIPAIQEQ